MTTETIVEKTFADAHEMLDTLAAALKAEGGVLYVETSDGDGINGFSIVEHTLTDGSTVRELIFNIE